MLIFPKWELLITQIHTINSEIDFCSLTNFNYVLVPQKLLPLIPEEILLYQKSPK